jgi:hypothetical protein
VWELNDISDGRVAAIMATWRNADAWSQPSDRAAVLAALLQRLGRDRLRPYLN